MAARWLQSYFAFLGFFHRAAAAFWAISERRRGLSFCIRTLLLALPPFFPMEERYFETAVFFVAILFLC
jgi:hypothetical protein